MHFYCPLYSESSCIPSNVNTRHYHPACVQCTYLLRLSSSSSVRNIGRQFVSSWHNRWQQSSCRSSLYPSPPDLLLMCLAMSSWVFQCSSCHLQVSILWPGYGLVGGSRRMCPMKRLLLVATMSCNAVCPERFITSSFVM